MMESVKLGGSSLELEREEVFGDASEEAVGGRGEVGKVEVPATGCDDCDAISSSILTFLCSLVVCSY